MGISIFSIVALILPILTSSKGKLNTFCFFLHDDRFLILAPSLLSWEGEDFIRVRAAPPKLIVVRAGSVLRLSCSMLASPAPRVTWVRVTEASRPGVVGSEVSRGGLAETAAVLSVQCVDRSHSGVFSCRGESGKRMVEVVTRVVVTGELATGCGEEGEPPVITNWFKTLMVPIGQPAALDCKLKVHIHILI